MLPELGRDARHALRILGRNPLFTAVAILSLALGIGANTVVFSLFNALLFQPLPVREPGGLVSVFTADPSTPWGTTSYADLADLREGVDAFDGLIGYTLARLQFQSGEDGDVSTKLGERVTGNYFTGLGVKPEVGRLFTAEEDVLGGERNAVLSHRLWQERFGGDPAVVGRVVRLNRQSFTVIGVVPERFRDTFAGLSVDLWIPYVASAVPLAGGEADLTRRGHRDLLVIGRLRPGATLAQARGQMESIGARLAQANPATNENRTFSALPTQEAGIHPRVRQLISSLGLLLAAVVGTILVIACLNLANLLLAKSMARRHEVGVRLAIGATRKRLIRQLLVESVLLAMIGGAAGLVLSLWVLDLLRGLRPPDQMPIALEITMDARVLTVTLFLSVLTGVLFGLAPALQATRPELTKLLVSQVGEGVRRRFSLRNLLVVSQVAVSIVLLVGAGLFLRSLSRLEGINPGFDVSGVLLVRLDLASLDYQEGAGQTLYNDVIERVRNLPGVRSVSFGETVPLGFERNEAPLRVAGRAEQPEVLNYNIVDPGYFNTLGIPLLRGRDFGPQDRADAPGVAIINESAARRYWPGEEALGKRFEDSQGGLVEVVGIVRDSKYRFLGEEPTPYLYVPLAQNYESGMTLHVKAAGDPLQLAARVRESIQSIDPRLAVDPNTLEDQLAFALLPRRIGGIVFLVFGVLALGLACMGIYGVMSQSVNQRSREMAIRMSLGAGPRNILNMVIRESMTLVAVGTVLGLVAAFPTMGFVGSFLFGVSTTDPVSFMVVIVLLSAAAALASYFPARRAARFDPMMTMRMG